jgi:glutamine synthetase
LDISTARADHAQGRHQPASASALTGIGAAGRRRITAGSLGEVLDALEEDHQYLLQGEVFTRDVIETRLDYKRTRELDPIRLRPHPWEFALYFDI